MKQIVDLDVRDILREKQEPFHKIMSTVQELGEGDVLQLHTTFEPAPLLKALGQQGFQNTVRQESDDHFVVQFYRHEATVLRWHVDNRGLEPPQPLVRTLELLEQDGHFHTGEWNLQIWNERVPALLLPELTERGYSWQVEELDDGTVIVNISSNTSASA